MLRSWPPGISGAEEHDLDFFGAEAKRRLGSDMRDLQLRAAASSSSRTEVGQAPSLRCIHSLPHAGSNKSESSLFSCPAVTCTTCSNALQLPAAQAQTLSVLATLVQSKGLAQMPHA